MGGDIIAFVSESCRLVPFVHICYSILTQQQKQTKTKIINKYDVYAGVNLPMVKIVVEGGIGTLRTVIQAVEKNIPVLVLEGSGGAADLIAAAYNLSKNPNK